MRIKIPENTESSHRNTPTFDFFYFFHYFLINILFLLFITNDLFNPQIVVAPNSMSSDSPRSEARQSARSDIVLSIMQNSLDRLDSLLSVNFGKSLFRACYELLPCSFHSGLSTRACPRELSRKNLGLLHICAAYDSLECFILLENLDVEIQQLSGDELHPIHYACGFGSIEVLTYILKKCPSEAKCDGLILLATNQGFDAVLNILFANEAKYDPADFKDPNQTPTVIALKKREYRCLKVLLQNSIQSENSSHSLLTLAVNSCSVEAVQVLLEAGESPDPRDSDEGCPPLARACFFGQEEIVELLLDKSIEIESPKGCSCVHWLCQSRSPRIAKMMLEKGVIVSRIDQDGFIGPHYLIDSAADQDAIEILQLLMESQWDINQPYGPNHSTLLGEYLESIRKPVTVIKWLIEHGANLDGRAWSENQTILDALKARPGLQFLAKG
jgi:ankyrin repeat protein